MRKKSGGYLAASYHEPCERLRIALADLEAKSTRPVAGRRVCGSGSAASGIVSACVVVTRPKAGNGDA